MRNSIRNIRRHRRRAGSSACWCVAAACRQSLWDPNGNAYRLPWRFSALRPPLWSIRVEARNWRNPTSLGRPVQRVTAAAQELPAGTQQEFGHAQEQDDSAQSHKERKVGEEASLDPLLREKPKLVADKAQAADNERGND